MAQKRRGRPPKDPDSKKERDPLVSARIPKDVKKSLKDLAKRHGQTVSAEVSRALTFWVKRHESSQLHNSHLAHTIKVLIDGIERLTGHSWMDHALTRQVVREYVERLVARVLLPLAKRVTVPAEVKEEAETLLTLFIHATGSRRLAGTVIVDDRDLAILTNDLAQKWGTPANVETRPALVARRKQDEKAWADALRIGTEAVYADYIKSFPGGRYITRARKRPELAAWREQEAKAWVKAKRAGTTEALRRYLGKFGALHPQHFSKARKPLVAEERKRLAGVEKQGRK